MIRYLFFLLLISSAPLYSHEIKPAIVDITILEGKASIEFKLNAETILSEIDASVYDDTNNSPQFQKYDELRSLSASEIEKLVLEDKFNFLNKIQINSGDEDVGLVLNKVTTFEEENSELPRNTILNLDLELTDSSFSIQFNKKLGPVVIRQFEDSTKETALLTTYLQPGEKSPLLSNQSQSTAGNTIIEYLILGIEHILSLIHI